MLIITTFDGTCLVPHCFSVALGKQALLHGFAAHWRFTLSATLVDIFAYIKSHVFFGVYCADSVGNDTVHINIFTSQYIIPNGSFDSRQSPSEDQFVKLNNVVELYHERADRNRYITLEWPGHRIARKKLHLNRKDHARLTKTGL